MNVGEIMKRGYKKIFSTGSGAEYYSNGREWIRLKDGEERCSIICMGSIKPGSNRSVHEDCTYSITELVYQLGIEKEVPGFEEEFVIGNLPFTLVGCKPGNVIYKDGIFEFKDGIFGLRKFKSFRSISLGSRITELYDI